MKKASTIVSIIMISLIIFVLGFDYKKGTMPNDYYQVYLNGDQIGTITSKDKLARHIDAEGNLLKNKFGVANVYAPNGLEIRKITTYVDHTDSIPDVYAKIEELEPFTIEGYQFTIHHEDQKQIIYVLDQNIFEDAVVKMIETFVGKENYQKYVTNTQNKIETTGTYIENIYVENNITIKQTKIDSTETIYTDSGSLSQFLLFGSNSEKKEYEVKMGDTIRQIANDNQISIEEFLISNPTFTNVNNLVFPGQKVLIWETSPQIQVAVEQFVTEDIVSDYRTEERYDPDRLVGDDEIVQNGESGLERVSQNVKLVNGGIVYVDPKGKSVLKPTVNKIVIKGEKVIPNVGTLTNWAWPTNSGWTISDDYAWRIHPITFRREFHPGLDIAGNGYNSPVYAANNGTIVYVGYTSGYGNHIIINHNNGYYSLYAHMNKFVSSMKVGTIVAKGQQIGYVGSTGSATGPHCHFEVWKGCMYNCDVNPWSFYR